MSMSTSSRARTSFRAALLAAVLALAAVAGGVSRAAATPAETRGTFGPVSFGTFVFGRDGAIYTTDCGNARIYRVDRSGAVHVFAGSGPGGFQNGDAGDGGPALDAHFGCPMGLAFDTAGRLFVADHLNNKIRRIDRDGTVHTVAGQGPRTWGTGTPHSPTLAHAGDGGPAIDGVLDAPWDITFDASGNLYVGDRDHDAIRRIDTAGIITTVAGAGERGYRGDGGPATNAKLNGPLEVAFAPGGRMIIADENNARIRQVDPRGVITTIGGTGALGCTGDGGAATAARLQNPHSIDVGPGGVIAVASGECGTVRAIGADGIVRLVAGTGALGCAGLDGGLATAADLSEPAEVRYAPNGELYLTDGCGLERIDAAGRIHRVADPATAGG